MPQVIYILWEILETKLLKALLPLRIVILGLRFQIKALPLKSESCTFLSSLFSQLEQKDHGLGIRGLEVQPWLCP